MDKKALFLIGVLALGALNLASVRKAENPILATQTNGILYEQKKEEEKDGKKGPLMYNVKYNPKDNFLVAPPIEAETKSPGKAAVVDTTTAPVDNADWWEEQPTGPAAPSPREAVEAPLPESSPAEEKAPDLEASEPAVPAGEADASATGAESEKAPAGKGDDYWW